jgi:hypothetical protein
MAALAMMGKPRYDALRWLLGRFCRNWDVKG